MFANSSVCTASFGIFAVFCSAAVAFIFQLLFECGSTPLWRQAAGMLINRQMSSSAGAYTDMAKPLSRNTGLIMI